MSLPLLAYAAAMAVLFHLFVTGYEEPTLRRRFGGTYLEYQPTVPRWIPAGRATVRNSALQSAALPAAAVPVSARGRTG
jgi:hypothetical protein